VQLPDNASLQRTREVLAEVDAIAAQTAGVENRLAVAGYSLLDGAAGSNKALLILALEPWEERKSPELHQSAIVRQLNMRLYGIQEAQIFAFPAPSLPGVGVAGGFTFMMQNRAGVDFATMSESAQSFIQTVSQDPVIGEARTGFRANTPQLFVDVDREQVKKAGGLLTDIYSTLQVMLGAVYVNDFTLFGSIFDVRAQADAKFRASPESITSLNFRGQEGRLIPLGTVLEVREQVGPDLVVRYNGYPAVKITGQAAPGFSSGQALDRMEELAAEHLPTAFGYQWSEMSFQERAAGSNVGVFFIAIVMVYLVLAAQYESWTLPISVCLAVPTALLGAVAGLYIGGMANDIYTQVGIVLLIALSTKSAILIVEFAKELHAQGKTVAEAAVEATQLRFRAVLMTALSFILGVIPLLIASGAGAESRQVIGAVVFYGMIAATLLGLIVVPVLFYIVQTLTNKAAGR
jgi:HAE1 family hydrophobic/amphiphilic exporter-1